MVDPIRFNTFQSVYWPNAYEPIEEQPRSKEDLQGAEAEVAASLYYQSSIQSLSNPGMSVNESNRLSVSAAQEVKKEKSFIQKIGDWIWSLFGKETAQEEEINVYQAQDQPAINLNQAPQLQPPERRHENQNLAAFFCELNRSLDKQLKDMAEFEEEMHRASSKQLDKLIFKELISCHLMQKQFKEHFNTIEQEEIMQLYKRNKELQNTHYSLFDEINKRAKTNKVLHWINVGTTVGIAGTLAAILATGGGMAVFTLALPMLTVMKGSTTLSEGILKYQNDRASGNLFLVDQETKANSSQISQKLLNLQETNEYIGELFKTIRHHLDNQSRAERIFRTHS